eukprot:m.73629 g.73629  ORF g.73629 m.73629 type:complete len:61 (-) comp8034_c1_seq1:77-259(-)
MPILSSGQHSAFQFGWSLCSDPHRRVRLWALLPAPHSRLFLRPDRPPNPSALESIMALFM